MTTHPAPPRPARRLALAAALAAALALTLVAAPRALACSCTQPGPPAVELENADAVFSGRVLSVEPIGDRGAYRRLAVRFALAAAWKGVPEGDEVTVTTSADGATCGYSFEVGEEYLVYAHGDPGDLSTGLCTRNDRLDRATEDLTALGEPTRKVARQAAKTPAC